jgi:glyoxylase-like metal-dependent hydrolase (beta-lactamase superfamily II)
MRPREQVMIVERSMHRSYLSNSYLVADEPGGHAVVVDTGAPPAPILKAIDDHGLTVTHVLCTHHHIDHVEHNETYRRRFGCPICGHRDERDRFRSLDRLLEDGEQLTSGKLRIRALHVPGHTVGQLAFLVDDERVFTGDTLFRRTVGGTCGPGHASFEDLRHSIMDVLMQLPRQTIVHPGHMDETTIGEEWEENPFVRVWRGLDPTADKRCVALGRPAELLLRAGWMSSPDPK